MIFKIKNTCGHRIGLTSLLVGQVQQSLGEQFFLCHSVCWLSPFWSVLGGLFACGELWIGACSSVPNLLVSVSTISLLVLPCEVGNQSCFLGHCFLGRLVTCVLSASIVLAFCLQSKLHYCGVSYVSSFTFPLGREFLGEGFSECGKFKVLLIGHVYWWSLFLKVGCNTRLPDLNASLGVARLIGEGDFVGPLLLVGACCS